MNKDKNPYEITPEDLKYINHTIDLGKEALSEGNLPIGAVIVLDDEVIATGKNQVLSPNFNPVSHAEMNAFRKVRSDLFLNHSKEMTLYTNIEPCIMCFGSIIINRIGRVVYGATDPNRGATYLVQHLEKIYTKEKLPIFIGPALQEECSKMFTQADEIYRKFRDNK